MSANEGPEQDTTAELEYIYVQGLGFVPQSPLETEQKNLRLYANAAGAAILLYFFLQARLPRFIINVLTQFFPNIRYFNSHVLAPEWVIQLVTAFSCVMCYFLAFGLYVLFFKIPMRVAFPLRRPSGKMLLPAVFISLAVVAIAALVNSILSGMLWGVGLISITPKYSIPFTPEGIGYALINLCILPAVAGQLVFGGVILQSLRRFGDAFAIVAAAALFSMSGVYVMQIPSRFLTALVVGYFVIRTNSIWVGIIVYFCNNLWATGMMIIMPHITAHGAELITLLLLIVFIILGLISTVVLSNKSDNLFYLNSPRFYLSARRRMKIFFTSPLLIILIVFIIFISLNWVQRLPR